MSTLKLAISVPDVRLRFVEDPPAAQMERPSAGVYVLAPAHLPERDKTRHQIVIVQPDDPRLTDGRHLTDLMSLLVAGQATGVALALRDGTEVADEVRREAHRHGVPLLAIGPEPAKWMCLHRALTDDHHSRMQRTAELHSQLIEQLRHLGRTEGTQRIVSWLASVSDAEVTLTTARGTIAAAAPASAATATVLARERIAELAAAGRGRSAALDLADGRQMRLFTVGSTTPAPVLAVTCQSFCVEVSAALARVLDLLAARLALEEAERRHSRLQSGEHVVREAVFSLLMAGQVNAAKSAAVGLDPGTLDAGIARTFILKVPPPQRPAIVQQCHDEIGTKAVITACPTYPDRIVILVPSTIGDIEATTLSKLVTHTHTAPGRFLGGSALHTLDETPTAYQDAARALTVAERLPGRVHCYVTEIQLAYVLDQQHAGTWATHLLRPLHELPASRREPLLATLRLGLVFPPAATARMLGTHRNTAARRMAEAAALLGVDLQDVWQRALVGLALQVRAETAHLQSDADTPAVTDILDTPEVRRWAHQFLGRLDTDRRPLRETLTAWIRAKTRIEDTAQLVGLNPATVRIHLRSAEELLQRRLLTNTASTTPEGYVVPGAHDLVLAFFVVEGTTLRPACQEVLSGSR
ncbi:helix-turn-helix domain-containing protein [Kitasatospora indigofera]|uniref:helix-turn-helix domain-containing protein n=1 Tax=Kitasatospora indigofera TaxID=67307 RepID=UPI0033ACEC15